MHDKHSTRTWWGDVEQAALQGLPARLPDPVASALADAHHYELYHQTDAARQSLANVTLPRQSPWQKIRRLVHYRLEARLRSSAAQQSMFPALEHFADSVASVDSATCARALHLMGVIRLRLGHYTEAEEALARAIAMVEESPSRLWILDGFSQTYLGTGAWNEARRTLDYVIREKSTMRDLLGLAISAGHLALMELRLGNPQRAYEVASAARNRSDGRLTTLGKLRLQTLRVEAQLELNDRTALKREADNLEKLLNGLDPEPHYLKGFAAVALARAASFRAASKQWRGWLKRADHFCQAPDQRALLQYWEGKLDPALAASSGWRRRVNHTLRACKANTDAEVLIHLHLAKLHQEKRQFDLMHAYLDRAFTLATRGNNRLLMEVVDRDYAQLDPRGFARKMVERFSGGSDEDVTRSVKRIATMVFVDLANFTARSTELAPAEVMATVRSLFELGTPLLNLHRVRPVTYLGDGLLACATGPGHRARALQFAVDLARRARRATRVREAMSERWGLDIRAGVASGPVVLGPLGNLLKLDFAAIGLTTNLASRLQGQAHPGEVLCEARSPVPGYRNLPAEHLELKGFDLLIPAVRIVPIE